MSSPPPLSLAAYIRGDQPLWRAIWIWSIGFNGLIGVGYYVIEKFFSIEFTFDGWWQSARILCVWTILGISSVVVIGLSRRNTASQTWGVLAVTIAFVPTSIFALGLALLCAMAAWERCDKFEETLAQDTSGHSIVSDFTACTLFGTELEVSVFLVVPPGRRELLFSYGPNPGIVVPNGMNAPLVAKWLPTGELEISVGSVTDIFVQKQQVSGVPVRYKIGTRIQAIR